MTAATGFYSLSIEDSYDATALDINLDGDTVNLIMVTDTYTPNFDTHDFYADITNEVTGTGYVAGGQALDTPTWANATGLVRYDSADEVWTTATISGIRAGVTYDATVSNRLLHSVTLGADFSVTAGNLTWQVHANGHFQFDVIP